MRFKEAHTSSRDIWREADDDALMVAIRNATTVDWVKICETAFPNKTRSAAACRFRWEQHLNPAFVTSNITPEERRSIISDFDKYDFNFGSYKINNRSPFVLRTLLYKHVCSKHTADGGVALVLFKTLQPLLVTNSEVSLDDWVGKSIENVNHLQCYKAIIHNNTKFFYNWFGVEIRHFSCRIVKAGWFQLGKLDKPKARFEVSTEEKAYIQSSIHEFQKLERDSIPVTFNCLFKLTQLTNNHS